MEFTEIMSTAKTQERVSCPKCPKTFKALGTAKTSGLNWHLARVDCDGSLAAAKRADTNADVTANTNTDVEKLPEIDPRLLSKNGRPLWGNALKMRIAKIAEQDTKPSKKIKVTADNGSHELSPNGGLDNAELDWKSRQEISREFEAMREAFADYKQRIIPARLEQELATIVSGKRLIEKQQQIDSEAFTELQIEVARLKDESATHCQLQQSSSETIEQIQIEVSQLGDRVVSSEVEIYNIQEELAQRFRSDHVTVDSDNSKLTAQVERLVGEQHAISDALRSLIPNETS